MSQTADGRLRRVLARDANTLDIVNLGLTWAVQPGAEIGGYPIAATELPPPNTLEQTFCILDQAGVIDTELSEHLKRAVGFCNIAVHDYEAVDRTLVHCIYTQPLGVYRDCVRAALKRS